ncbi:MAG: UPF0147 family protein [Candidatus Bilamarchaeaceae archaeon]
MAVEKSLKAVHDMMEEMLQDTTIPKNIRKAISEAKTRIEGNDELSVKISASIYLIESVSNDINMPPHARTQLWAIMGALESVKK